MKRDRAADTQASLEAEAQITADLLADAARLAQSGSDSTEEAVAAPDLDEADSDETASEASAAQTTATPAKATKDQPATVSESRSQLDATMAQVALLEEQINRTTQQAAQAEKDRREAQSYGDRQRNELSGIMATKDAQIAELTRQLQAVSTRQPQPTEDDDDYFQEKERTAMPDIQKHPVVAQLLERNERLEARLNQLEQGRTAEMTAAQQAAEQQRIQNDAAALAREDAQDIFGKTIETLDKDEHAVIRGIVLCFLSGQPDMARRLEKQAMKLATEERMAKVRQRSMRSRVISEAGMSSSTDDRFLGEDAEQVLVDLDLKNLDGLTDPQIAERTYRGLLKAAEKMAKQPA